MPLPSHYPPKGSIYFLFYDHRLILPAFECYVNGIMHYMLLCLTFFMQYYFCEIHYVIEQRISLFFFISYAPLHEHTTIHSMHGYLDCVHFFAIVKMLP